MYFGLKMLQEKLMLCSRMLRGSLRSLGPECSGDPWHSSNGCVCQREISSRQLGRLRALAVEEMLFAGC